MACAVSLTTLASCANEAHEHCLKGLRRGLQHAITAGKALLEAKEQLGHGKFEAWVEVNCCFGIRTAQLYLNACTEVRLVGGEAQDIAPDTPEEVLRYFLRKTSVADDPKEKKPPRVEAWIRFEEHIVDWMQANDNAAFASRWLRRLADDIEQGMHSC